LDVSKPAVSRTLASLEAKRYITRQRDSKDKRAHRIWLTEKALKTGPSIEQTYNDVFTQALQGISQDELDFFLKLFSRISENFAHTTIKE
jgi:DNA-binding MarR family transcriptional regulator